MSLFSRWKRIGQGRQSTPTISRDEYPLILRGVEFIGPSGVGKSTFCEAYRQVSSIPWGHAGDIAGLRLVGGETELDGSIHWKLLSKKLEYLDRQPLNRFRSAKLMYYFSQVVSLDLMLFYSEGPAIFLLDEGICHNFAGQLIELNETDFRYIMSGRALVYVRPRDPELVVYRIRKRAMETGFMVTHHIGLDHAGLVQMVEESLGRFGKLMEKLQAYHIPHCVLDAEYSITDAQEACLVFERKNLVSL